MTQVQIVSLGAWCRPAFQVRRYAEAHPATAVAITGPFDWTVTPFAALRACLAPGFVPQGVLASGQCRVSVLASAACNTSGVIFHHALPPDRLREMGLSGRDRPIPVQADFDAAAADARGRFAHTFRNLTGLRDAQGHVLFVRWQRKGHPDHQLPDAFDGETDAAMLALLAGFLGHDRFHLLTVVSRTTAERRAEFRKPLIDVVQAGRALTCHLDERAGWNGDQTANFRGDDHSWTAALDAAMAGIPGRRAGLRETLARLGPRRYRFRT